MKYVAFYVLLHNFVCICEDDDKEDARSSAADEEEMHEEEKEYRGLNDFFENEAELSGSEVGRFVYILIFK